VVHTPYTSFFFDAFMAAHIAIGVMLIALLWSSLPKWPVARMLLYAATLLAVVAPLLGEFLKGFGAKSPPLHVVELTLIASTCLVVCAVATMRRLGLVAVTCGVVWLLAKCPGWFEDSMSEICAAHLVWIGVVLGLLRRRTLGEPKTVWLVRSPPSQDVLIFAASTLVAVAASIFVLQRADGSADEWAYTWQAAVFAKGHVYGAIPPCEKAFQSFYVFPSLGRLFAQYTPGWPFFMTPFVFFGVPWLAGPVAHGLMAVGVARVARRAVTLDGRGTPASAAAAGLIAAAVATFSVTTLLVGASRYSHVFVITLFAWAMEAALILGTDKPTRDRQVRWGLVLGSTVALMGASRPADGAALATGLAFYFVYCLARRRIGSRAFLAALGSFVFWGGLTLVILRIQLGTWFTTGYSLYSTIHTWDSVKYGWPRPSEWKFALPLATGSYCWFPCSLAVGMAGIVSLRRGASSIIPMTLFGLFFFELHYQYLNLGRGFDWGYGPRYETPFIAPMALGVGIALAPLVEKARRRSHAESALTAGGPLAVVLATMVVTVIRLWPLLYPGIYAHVHQHDSLNERIREMHIHHAVVMAQVGATGFDPLDLTENLPLDLYPHQDVLIAIERKPEYTQCVRTNFPDRAVYRATGNPVVITPY
jgi:hypothetical protein